MCCKGQQTMDKCTLKKESNNTIKEKQKLKKREKNFPVYIIYLQSKQSILKQRKMKSLVQEKQKEKFF